MSICSRRLSQMEVSGWLAVFFLSSSRDLGFAVTWDEALGPRNAKPKRGRCSSHASWRMVILWMDEILHHLRNHGKPLFVGIYMGIIILGLLRWCMISSIHSRCSFGWSKHGEGDSWFTRRFNPLPGKPSKIFANRTHL